jgi:hypothetical protein
LNQTAAPAFDAAREGRDVKGAGSRPVARSMARLAVVAGFTLVACAATPRSVTVVPFVTGPPMFASGDSIEIEEIVGTRVRLEVGGAYIVSGHATLASRDSARLALYSTGSGDPADDGPRTEGSKNVVIERGTTVFHFTVTILRDGDLHLILAPAEDEWANQSIGGIYFRDPQRPFLYGGVERLAEAPPRH